MLYKMMIVAAAVAALSIGVVPTDSFARGGGGGGGGGHGGGGFGGGHGGGGFGGGGLAGGHMSGGFGGGHMGGGFGAIHGGGFGPARGFAGSHERGHGERGEGFHHARHFRRGFDGYGYGYTCDFDSPYYPYYCASPYYGYGG